LITNSEKFALHAEDIEKVLLSLHMEDRLTVQEMHAYNKETVRIYLVGGVISKRKMYMLDFGTTFRRLKQVSS